MIDKESLQKFLERALALAHAALESPSREQVTMARSYADELLPHLRQMKRLEFTLAEARQIVVRVTQLRILLAAVDRRVNQSQPLRYG